MISHHAFLAGRRSPEADDQPATLDELNVAAGLLGTSGDPEGPP